MHELQAKESADELAQAKKELWDLLVSAEASGILPKGMPIEEIHGVYSATVDDISRIFETARAAEKQMFLDYVDSLLDMAFEQRAVHQNNTEE